MANILINNVFPKELSVDETIMIDTLRRYKQLCKKECDLKDHLERIQEELRNVSKKFYEVFELVKKA